MNKFSQIDLMRYIGNLLALVGYGVLLHYSPLYGGVIKLIGLFLVLPSCYKLKLYDVMFMLGLFGLLDLSNVIKILST